MYIIPVVGEIGKEFKYSDLLMHLNAAKDINEILLIVDSPGGDLDEGMKMRKALDQSNKILYSKNSGDVASAAVAIFTAPKNKLNRLWSPEKGQFLIHNPYLEGKGLDEMGFILDAATLESLSVESKKIEKDLAAIYAKDTGTDVKVLKAFMDENTPLTPEQIESLGFATIQKHELKAVAYININNKKQEMENVEIEKRLTGIESLLKTFKNMFKHKALMIQDVNGNELDFGDAVQTPEEIVVGITATVAGQPAEGEYTMDDGTILVFAAGALTEIRPANDQMAALKQENESLKAELEAQKALMTESQKTLSALKAESEKQVKAIETEFLAFKNQYSKENTPSNGGIHKDEPTIRKPFKNKE